MGDPSENRFSHQDKFLEPAPADLQRRGVVKVLPGKFIAGYLELGSLRFHKNIDFVP